VTWVGLRIKSQKDSSFVSQKKKKKPDSVVFDEKEGYNAAILPYGTSVGAPAITLENIGGWKEQGTLMVNKELKSRFKELEDQYIKLVEEHRWNELVYAAEFNFEPVIWSIVLPIRSWGCQRKAIPIDDCSRGVG